MKTEAKILICYNAPVSIFTVYNGKPVHDEPIGTDLSEKSFLKELNIINKSLSEFYTEVETLAIDRDVQKSIHNINEFNPDVIYNFVESVEGIASYEWCMAGLFELLGFEYTGCNPASLGNCLNKARAKNILNSRGIITPHHITLNPNARFTKKDITINYPAIIKLLSEDASIGISEYSVVKNYTELRKQFKFLTDTYKQEVIIEEYIEGRELNIAILGNKVLPVSEIDFKGLPEELPSIVTYDGKWIEESIYYNHTRPVCPVDLNERIKNKIIKAAIDSFEALDCRDYARIDVRLNKKNIPYVIEVNPNPDISTDSGFARAAAADGVTHKELLYTIANFALTRKKIYDTQVKAG
ncbi:MAG: ATP-grasp domain-containing protein [Ignavibacteriaceae bacterium]|nr:ATP-grasp domain-containing protein [Ignavibacteriaceae bacterium]